jgi:hypothetical protein
MLDVVFQLILRLFILAVLIQDTGTEQHRHHTVEIAVFNILSALWEIETGVPYVMSKPNDIFSGLGKDAEAIVPAKSVPEYTEHVQKDEIECKLLK